MPSSVALLAEGVDRNYAKGTKAQLVGVALLAEGVDRNLNAKRPAAVSSSRPPRGGRG